MYDTDLDSLEIRSCTLILSPIFIELYVRASVSTLPNSNRNKYASVTLYPLLRYTFSSILVSYSKPFVSYWSIKMQIIIITISRVIKNMKDV